MSLRDNPEMMREIAAHPTYRAAMMALHTFASGDLESEVLRGMLKLMDILLSRGHSDESALTSLKMLTALHTKISQLDSDLAFTDRQMIAFMTLFARNSKCHAIILHGQLLRTMNLTTLPAVSKHLFTSFPSGTTVSADTESILDLSAPNSNVRACATTRAPANDASRSPYRPQRSSHRTQQYPTNQNNSSASQKHLRRTQSTRQSTPSLLFSMHGRPKHATSGSYKILQGYM